MMVEACIEFEVVECCIELDLLYERDCGMESSCSGIYYLL
jgi:hypothetical protein